MAMHGHLINRIFCDIINKRKFFRIYLKQNGVKKKLPVPVRNKYKKFWNLGSREQNTEYFDVNGDGELIVKEGDFQYNVYDLARKFGGAVKIFMPFVLKERLDNLMKTASFSMKKIGYRAKFSYHYPMKVNQQKAVLLAVISSGADLEVASDNDLWIVNKLWEDEGLNRKIRVICNGPKTDSYIAMIKKMRKKGLFIVPVIEDMNELGLLKDFNGELGIRINLLSKVKSHWDKKIDRFGLLLNEILRIGKIRNLKMLHYHIGSQIEKEEDIYTALKEAFNAYKKIRVNNPGLDTINMGGGFAIPYEKKKLYDVKPVVNRIFKTLRDLSAEAGIPHPNVIVEWGRFIAAPSQMTVYKVIARKDIPKGVAKKWYIVDGSFINDLLDTLAIHQKWHVVPVNNMNAKKHDRVWLAGLSCDSDDRYVASEGYCLLPSLDLLKKGESQYLAVLDTGAYQEAFTSHHCLLSSPAKILLRRGNVKILRRRETSAEVGKIFGW